MKLYTVNKDYINYLKQFDEGVPNVEYGERSIKPFVRTGVYTDYGAEYLAPVTCKKEWMKDTRDSLTLIKLYDNNTGEFLCGINFRYMIPVPQEMCIELNRSNLSFFRTFENEDEKWKLWGLYKAQMRASENKDYLIRKNTQKLRNASITGNRHFNLCHLNLEYLEKSGRIYADKMDRNEIIYNRFNKFARCLDFNFYEDEDVASFSFFPTNRGIRIDNNVYNDVFNTENKKPDIYHFHLKIDFYKNSGFSRNMDITAYYEDSYGRFLEIDPWMDTKEIASYASNLLRLHYLEQEEEQLLAELDER